ncbi:MAG: LacI family DNA-binding transcriptional regulator [Fimbriimonadaceae bacterium]
MRGSIKDVAKRAGVSISTVSYALNNGPKPVAPELKQKILRIADELGYQPSAVARSLISGRIHTVGVVHPYGRHDLIRRDFFREVLNGVHNAAKDHQHDILLYTRTNVGSPAEIARLLLDRRTDGIVFVGSEGMEEVLEIIHRRRAEYVVVCGKSPDPDRAVVCDNRDGVEQVVRHLAELGHRKVGHVAGRKDMVDAEVRLEHFQAETAAAGIELRPEWIRSGDFEAEPGAAAAREILAGKDRPTAIFAANDESALGVLHAAAAMGLRVPRDLSVVGFDDFRLASRTTPRLTTVRQPAESMATAAMEYLARRIEGLDAEPLGQWPTTLVVRESTGPAPSK